MSFISSWFWITRHSPRSSSRPRAIRNRATIRATDLWPIALPDSGSCILACTTLNPLMSIINNGQPPVLRSRDLKLTSYVQGTARFEQLVH